MSGKKSSELVVGDWLVELAARDAPPTVIDSKLLARLAATGVVDLPPATATEILHAAESVRATGIGAVGGGFGFVETFEGEQAPVAAALERLCVFLERYDLLRRLRFAAIDMNQVARTARALADRAGPARVFERALETALVVIYARAHLPRSRGGVGRRWQPEDEADRKLHRWIIDEMRHPYHAHTDRTALRTLVNTTAYFGLDGPPTFAESWRPLTDDDLAGIAELAERQHARFDAAAREVGAELGERRDAPSGPA